MPGQTITSASSLMCPHGGRVVITTSNTKALAGAPLATAADQFTIVGCAFTLPGPKPSPCLTVEWVRTDQKVSVDGARTLTTTSVGLCKAETGAPQGTVVVASTQTRLATT